MERKMNMNMKKFFLAFVIACCSGVGGWVFGQTAARASSTAAQAPAAPSPATPAAVPITDADLKAISPPAPEDRAKGDPGGSLTGTVGDIPVGDAKKGLAIGDVVNLVGQHQIAINFVCTFVTGLPVMFMQAGFAIVDA